MPVRQFTSKCPCRLAQISFVVHESYSRIGVLPGVLPGVAGLGRRRVVAGLGCRVAGARAQVAKV